MIEAITFRVTFEGTLTEEQKSEPVVYVRNVQIT